MRWLITENSAQTRYIPKEECCAACPGKAGTGDHYNNPMACATTISIYTVLVSGLYCVTMVDIFRFWFCPIKEM